MPKDIGASSYDTVTAEQQEREAASRRKTVVTVGDWALRHQIKPLVFIEMIDALELRAELDEILGEKRHLLTDELWTIYALNRDAGP